MGKVHDLTSALPSVAAFRRFRGCRKRFVHHEHSAAARVSRRLRRSAFRPGAAQPIRSMTAVAFKSFHNTSIIPMLHRLLFATFFVLAPALFIRAQAPATSSLTSAPSAQAVLPALEFVAHNAELLLELGARDVRVDHPIRLQLERPA